MLTKVCVISIHTACINRAQEKGLHQRLKLDRRRFESAHLQYAMLKTASRYPQLSSSTSVSSNLHDTLQKFSPAYYAAFMAKYSGTYVLVNTVCLCLHTIYYQGYLYKMFYSLPVYIHYSLFSV